MTRTMYVISKFEISFIFVRYTYVIDSSPVTKQNLLYKIYCTYLEFPTKYPPKVDIAGVGFDSLVVTQDLSCACCRHGSEEE